MAYEKNGVIYIEAGDSWEDVTALYKDERSPEEIAEAARRREALFDRICERIDAERAVENGEVDIH